MDTIIEQKESEAITMSPIAQQVSGLVDIMRSNSVEISDVDDSDISTLLKQISQLESREIPQDTDFNALKRSTLDLLNVLDKRFETMRKAMLSGTSPEGRNAKYNSIIDFTDKLERLYVKINEGPSFKMIEQTADTPISSTEEANIEPNTENSALQETIKDNEASRLAVQILPTISDNRLLLNEAYEQKINELITWISDLENNNEKYDGYLSKIRIDSKSRIINLIDRYQEYYQGAPEVQNLLSILRELSSRVDKF